MTITIDISNIKMIVYPDWGRVVFIFPNNEPVSLSLQQAE